MTALLNKASDIALALTTRLSTIKKVSGFNTDVGLNVMRGRRRIDDRQVPCVVLVEGADSVTPAPGRLVTAEVKQRYILVGYYPCDAIHPNDSGHLVIKDLKRAIFSDGVTLGGAVRKVEYKGRDIGPRGDGVDIVCATVEIEVSFAEDLQNP